MPRYYFDLHNDVDAIDEEGKDFPDQAAAEVNALAEAREMVSTSVIETGTIDLCHRIEVRDFTGSVVYVLHFNDAVLIKRQGENLNSQS